MRGAVQVVGPIQPGQFIAEDFAALAAYEHHKRTKPVLEALVDMYPPLQDAPRYALLSGSMLTGETLT